MENSRAELYKMVDTLTKNEDSRIKCRQIIDILLDKEVERELQTLYDFKDHELKHPQTVFNKINDRLKQLKKDQ